jgi:hypothetical protein
MPRNTPPPTNNPKKGTAALNVIPERNPKVGSPAVDENGEKPSASPTAPTTTTRRTPDRGEHPSGAASAGAVRRGVLVVAAVGAVLAKSPLAATGALGHFDVSLSHSSPPSRFEGRSGTASTIVTPSIKTLSPGICSVGELSRPSLMRSNDSEFYCRSRTLTSEAHPTRLPGL